ncbi:TetR/AcrR family transcriptional regulator [Paenibacillus motobuensis]|uniref:TetR/AcrR family transcriptional regulator n=1 Tax=Paenibacillus motobuensis TaxID=295324 RepID=A0ABN0YNY4_9BACL
MSSKSDDKKQLILRTTMQLFAAKGSSATSMQEIAELCGMSKGSLYLHFKSKDELELSLFDYCFQLLQSELVQVEQDSELSPRDKLVRAVEVLLELVLELREFLLMQFKEWIVKGNIYKNPDIMNKNNAKLIHYTKKILISAYGEAINPYMADLIIFSQGMIGSYAKLVFDQNMTRDTHRIAVYLIKLLDAAVELLLKNKLEPIIPEAMLHNFGKCGENSRELDKHPRLTIKEMKELLEKESGNDGEREQGIEALQILEEELLRPRPRRVILKGMVATLEDLDLPQIESSLDELQRLLRPYYAQA